MIVTSSTAPAIRPEVALFLDFDGTLVDFEDDPAAVGVGEALRRAVDATARLLDGALALISGRPIAQVDRLFGPGRLPVAGVHGLERRDLAGRVHRAGVPQALRSAAARLAAVLGGDPGVGLEDKGAALAIHFRAAPGLEDAVRRMASEMLAELGPDYRLLEGARVIELMPRFAHKGTAVRAFMAEAPFRGRRPVFVGDDVTDLDGFRAARELGGYGIAVGARVTAEYHLPDVGAVRGWLSAVA